jgi:hypothetical protein
MRELARHVLESRTDDAVHEWEGVLGLVEEWLVGKGYWGQRLRAMLGTHAAINDRKRQRW